MAGELDKDHTTVRVLNNLEATATFGADGFITQVAIATFPGSQKIAKWQGPKTTIAGYEMADADWDATKTSGTVTFTFAKDTENDPYITKIAFA